ncbi:MAG: SDR family NAD(P)-dependent oxidoreductase, partial [Burkholderiaceae bacterium]
MSTVLVVGASRGIGHEFARQYAADGARVIATHRKPHDAQRLRALGADAAACVLFEAPHRFADTARELAAALDPQRRVVVARELTKKFETIVALAARDLPAWAERHEPRGEYVIVIDAPRIESGSEIRAELDETTRRWLAALAEALPAARAAAVAARATGLPRELLY